MAILGADIDGMAIAKAVVTSPVFRIIFPTVHERLQKRF